MKKEQVFSEQKIANLNRLAMISVEQNKICKKHHKDLVRKHFSNVLMKVVDTCAICRWESHTPKHGGK